MVRLASLRNSIAARKPEFGTLVRWFSAAVELGCDYILVFFDPEAGGDCMDVASKLSPVHRCGIRLLTKSIIRSNLMLLLPITNHNLLTTTTRGGFPWISYT